jgi:hypothetical protein
MANMKIIPLIAAGDEASVSDAATMVERLTERFRVIEMAYLDHQAVIDALGLDLGALECRIARLEKGLPAGKYEAKKGNP